MEPWVNLRFSRCENGVEVDATLGITLGTGPDIQFAYECREAEVRATLEDIERVIAVMAER